MTVAAAGAPVLISEPTSTRAVAFTTPTFHPQPFPLTCAAAICQGQRTRVMLFVMGLALQPGEAAWAVTARAEDGTHRFHDLTVEHVEKVSGYEWMSAVVLKLGDEVGDVGDVLVRITYRGADSNRVRIAIGHLGGGPADDAGAFPSPAPPYSLGGFARDGVAGLGGVSVTVGGASVVSLVTGADGSFSLGGLPAGGSYTLTPSKPCYSFSSSILVVESLYRNTSVNFAGAENRIDGRVSDTAGQPLASVSIAAAGAGSSSAQTDAAGRFSLLCLTPGDYVITPTHARYDFTPIPLTVGALSGNRRADFNGTLKQHTIRGRVTVGGQPAAFVHIDMTGSQAGKAIADAGGNYAFNVPTGGDYTLTPSPKHFYAYDPPARSFSGLSAAQIANFSASPVAPPATQQVLEWDGSPKTVDYGYFFNTPGDLGHFFWEFWAMPGAKAGATYLLSDGYGGAHAILFGFGSFSSSELGRYQLIGNVWNGTGIISFNSDEGPAIGEWGHYAVGWDGLEIITYFNGVPVGRIPWAGPRRPGGGQNGAGRLLIGGSDHNNLIGRIAQARGFEGVNPRENLSDPNRVQTRAAYAPDTVFRTGGQMLSNYFEPLQTVADLSAGFQGTIRGGQLRGTHPPFGLLTFCGECPRPVYVIDPTAPDFATETDRSHRVFNPPPVPGGAVVYDSFSRRNSTYALGGNGGLGSPEGGTVAAGRWQSSTAPRLKEAFGILNERAVLLANHRALAWVQLPPTAAGHDIEVGRRAGQRGVGLDTGLSFRVADSDNYFFAFTTGDAHSLSARTLTVGFYEDGQRTELVTGLPVPVGWATLRVVNTPAGAIRVYANTTLVYSTTHSLHAAATGAGLYNDGPGLGLANRWDDFTVHELPAQ